MSIEDTNNKEEQAPIFLAGAIGVGVNSIAMLIGWHERGIKPDVLTFADTGAERKYTYATLEKLRGWCSSVGFPDVNVVRKVRRNGEVETLEESLHRLGVLPSPVYGAKQCSDRFKIQPQNKFLNNYAPAKAWLKSGGVITRAIGFDAKEWHRQRSYDDPKYVNTYPLVDWGWDRDDCVEKCREYGFCGAKSSCFFCPNMKKSEIISLHKHDPELFQRAIDLEVMAAPKNTKVKGLGRSYSWLDVIKADEEQLKLFEDPPSIGCGCMNI